MRLPIAYLLAAWSLLLAASCGDGSGAAETGPAQWDVVVTEDNGITVLVFAGWTTCDHVESVEVQETDEAIAIVATASSRDDRDCTDDDPRTVQRSVTLEHPIGERTLRGCRPEQPLFDMVDFGDVANTDCWKTQNELRGD